MVWSRSSSDTTSTTLAHIFFELTKHPEHIERVREELHSAVPSRMAHDVRNHNIQHLDHLNGVINEALRLHPPVPTAIPRLTPPEGVTIGERFIPGSTTVWCPQDILGRSESSRRRLGYTQY